MSPYLSNGASGHAQVHNGPEDNRASLQLNVDGTNLWARLSNSRTKALALVIVLVLLLVITLLLVIWYLVGVC